MKLFNRFNRFTKQRRALPRPTYPLPAADLFPTPLIAHFSYHKCLTVYYIRILRRLSNEFGFIYEHLNADRDSFVAKAITGDGKRVLSINNRSDIPWAQLPPFQATHFVRDPRDLVVSGYRYHLWTQEAWCINPQFKWHTLVQHPLFGHVEADPRKYPKDISYQEYLKTLAPERGLLLEMLWRQPHFRQMQVWAPPNKNVLELRYEDIIGNEPEMFQRAFAHYGFHPQLSARGVALAEEYSLKNQTTRPAHHIRKGTRAQWRDEFTPLVKQLFKQEWNPLLLQLGYAHDADW
jgi:hypothetical protein